MVMTGASNRPTVPYRGERGVWSGPIADLKTASLQNDHDQTDLFTCASCA
jgi:hypothetical protein